MNYSRAGRPACVAPVAGKAAGYRGIRKTPALRETGGGRWMASALRASALRAAPSAHSASFACCRTSGGSHPPPTRPPTCPAGETLALRETGGGRWIRTTEGVSQQIYSLPPLAAWVSLRLSSMENQGLPKSPQFWSARGRLSTVIDSKCRRSAQTLKRKCSTSPSCTRYSLPSRRSRPASRAPASPLYLRKSS